MGFDTLRRDLQGALRLWRRRPLLTLVLLLTLALGFSATSVIASVVEAVLLAPLPYQRPDRLLVIRGGLSPAAGAASQLSGPELAALRDRARAFEQIGAVWARPGVLGLGPTAVEIEIGWITPGFLEVFGVAPALGRLPGREEHQRTDVIVLGDDLWRQRFGADPSIVGRRIEFDGEPRTVLAVMPPGFRMLFAAEDGVPESMEGWLPWGSDPGALARTFRVFTVIGRVRDGITPGDTGGDLQAVAASIAQESPEYGQAGFALTAEPLASALVDRIRPALLVVAGVVAIVLVIACTNVASLLSILAMQRATEFSVRAALGASRGRLQRQVFAETLLLSAGAAGLGIWLAAQGLALLRRFDPSGLPRVQDAAIDGTTLALVTLMAAASAIGTGSVALRRVLAAAPAAHQAIRGGVGGSRRTHGVFVAAQFALAVILLAGASLLIRTFIAVTAVPLGFEPAGVLSARISLPDVRYPYRTAGPAIAEFYRQLELKLRELPGVTAAGATLSPPLADQPFRRRPYSYRTTDGDVPWGSRLADYRTVTPGWFQAMGVRVVDGRPFDSRDAPGRATAVLVDTSLADRVWPGRRAVGEAIRVEVFRNGAFAPEWGEVVGIVAPVRLNDLVSVQAEQVYLAHAQAPQRTMFLAVRAAGDPAAVAGQVQSAVQSLEPGLPIFEVQPAAAYVGRATAVTRFAMTALGIFAAIALALAGAGVFAAMSATVTHRRREIGVRLALGAAPAQVFAWALRVGLSMAGLGIAAGLLGALVATRLLASLLYAISPTDVLALIGTTAIAAALAVAACLLPAARAARIDPCRTLHAE